MEAWAVIKDILHIAVTLFGGVVSGLALRAWAGWSEEKKTTEARLRTVEDGHRDLTQQVYATATQVGELKEEHKKLSSRVHRHETNHVRVSTIVEQLLGKQSGPRFGTEGHHESGQ